MLNLTFLQHTSHIRVTISFKHKIFKLRSHIKVNPEQCSEVETNASESKNFGYSSQNHSRVTKLMTDEVSLSFQYEQSWLI